LQPALVIEALLNFMGAKNDIYKKINRKVEV